MVFRIASQIKLILKALLFIVLLTLFTLIYMKSALEQYIKGSTTVGANGSVPRGKSVRN